MKITKVEFDGVKKEIEDLMYLEPKCDFEHAWNCGVNAAHDCLNGYEGSE